MNQIFKSGRVFLAGACFVLALGFLAGCTATEPVQQTCKQYGFSIDGQRDSSWVVPCVN